MSFLKTKLASTKNPAIFDNWQKNKSHQFIQFPPKSSKGLFFSARLPKTTTGQLPEVADETHQLRGAPKGNRYELMDTTAP